jgi:hypothetical protein
VTKNELIKEGLDIDDEDEKKIRRFECRVQALTKLM